MLRSDFTLYKHSMLQRSAISLPYLTQACCIASQLLPSIVNTKCSTGHAGRDKADMASFVAQGHSLGQDHIVLQPLHWASRPGGVSAATPRPGGHPVR